jgi:hypothetical protein
VDTTERKVWLHVAKEDVERAPDLPEPSTPVESPIMNVLRGTTATWVLGPQP